MRTQKIKYGEGQWFAVPLRNGGYALGMIARGSYKTKICLGYFFGPRYENPPEKESTWEKNPEDAILIARFGDLGIITGSWPLIRSTRPFSKDDWPIPKFGAEVLLIPEKGYIREYEQDLKGSLRLFRETVVDVKEIVDLPSDSMKGGGAIEIRLTELLK